MTTPPARTEPAPVLREVRGRRSPRSGAGAAPEARYPQLLGCAAAALPLLRGLRVAVVGTGSVGGRIALLLARLGIGVLMLVDPKRYKAASLLTHEVGPRSVGRPKALEIGSRCKEISPATRVFAWVGSVEALDGDALADLDLVVMAPDRLSVEVVLAQRCRHLGQPLLQAAVHGETLTVQIRFCGNADPQGCCAACFLGPDEWRLVSQQARFSCEGAAGAAAPAAAGVPDLHVAPATNSFANLCSLAADLAVNQVLRHVLQLGEPVTDTLLEYCGYTNRTVVSGLARNSACPIDHITYRRLDAHEPLERLSLRALAQTATGGAVGEETVFEVGGLDWVESGACRCAQPALVRRFRPRQGGRVVRCPKCAAPVVPLQFYTLRQVGAAVLGSALDSPLRALGARRVRSVLVRTAESGVWIRHGTSASPPS